MPLFTVSFTEEDGYCLETRVWATTEDQVLALAVERIWGPDTYWKPRRKAPMTGRVYSCRDVCSGHDMPKTDLATVVVTLASEVKKGTPTIEAVLYGERALADVTDTDARR